MTPCQQTSDTHVQEALRGRSVGMQQSFVTDIGRGLQKIVAYSDSYLAGPY